MSITAIIIAKNEESMIANCIESLRWCDEILVIDNGSIDSTASVSEKLGARVIGFSSTDFSKVRNEGLKRSKTDWIFYVDADERVSPELAREIMVSIETNVGQAFKLKRDNICYGFPLTHGGWENDYVTRVFKRDDLTSWSGKIHESANFNGKEVSLQQPLLHLTHRSTKDNLYKSAEWTGIEADLLYKSGIKPVTLFTLIRKGLMEFIRRDFIKQGSKNGMVGHVEALVQAMNRVMVYIQVWELQQKPSLPDRYEKIEREISQKWTKQKDLQKN
ncbi:MAG: glycosyltransferase family 2 protein [Candidatus Pacebacteria bacterium]|nr:glycosyltransferase family 2 protein [Candidatus Paceibacterota bacterium]